MNWRKKLKGMGDLIIEHLFKQPIFTWGSHAGLTQNRKMREEYLAAIKAADARNITPLLKFARN